MNKGQIIECGSPDDLLARQGSQFRRLAQSQGLVDGEEETREELHSVDEEITEAS